MKKKKKRTKPGTYRFITNFLEGSIKDKKIEKLLESYDKKVVKVIGTRA